MFLVHSQIEDEAYDLGFEIGLFNDSAIDRSLVYGIPCLVDDGARARVYLAWWRTCYDGV